MMRAAGVITTVVCALGALALLGSDRWVAGGYQTATAVQRPDAGRDEAYWLSRPSPRQIEPVGAAGVARSADHLAAWQSRTFEVGTRLTLAGAERLNLEIVSSVPAAPDTGLLDAAGRPLIIVTARERKGVRVIRLLVEADRAPSVTEKSL